MFGRLSKNGRAFEEDTREHVNEYADAGLRTLILAYRELTVEEYKDFNKKFKSAENSVSADRETLINEATELVERDLVLLGATAVEDKLQQGVPECIDKLAQAGIKIWVLTGDKMETAINIGLLRQGMKQIIITLETSEIKQIEKEGEKGPIVQASNKSVFQQITEGKNLIASSENEAFALIIYVKSLAYALEDDLKKTFLDLAVGCSSVICCRSSPKQKVLDTRLVKEETGKMTLAIGDGANDMGMLQEADIWIGISGVEGMQAVMSSDINIAQFKFLERLLLVHGHWCYRRISSMFPVLYQEGVQNVLFSWRRIIGWMLNGLCTAIIIFFLCIRVLNPQAYKNDAKTAGMAILGSTLYTCVIWVVNCQMAVSISYFTLIQHIFIWGGICLVLFHPDTWGHVSQHFNNCL